MIARAVLAVTLIFAALFAIATAVELLLRVLPA
jgi:hypothetical protein